MSEYNITYGEEAKGESIYFHLKIFMKILFLRPEMPEEMEKEEPLGILYLITYLKDHIHDLDIDFFDQHISRWNISKLSKRIIESQYELILISSLTIGAQYAYSLISILRQYNFQGPIIMGGPHPTACPDECIKHGADICCIGEGEITLTKLLNAIKSKKELAGIPNIVYRENNSIIHNVCNEVFVDMSTLSFPDYSLLPDFQSYNTTIHLQGENNRALPIMASRGCANNCPFCSSNLIWKRRLRFRTVSSVVNEIEYNIMKYGIDQFHFLDDDLLANKNFIDNLANELQRKQLSIKFCCLTTVRALLNLSQLQLSKIIEAGLSVVEIGFETLMPNVLSYLKKTYTLDQLPDLINIVNKNNIDVRPLLMYLVPGETLSGYNDASKRFINTIGQINYVKENWIVDNFSISRYSSCYTRLPGTTFYNDADKLGLIIEDDIYKGDTDQITFAPFSLVNDVPRKINMQLTNIDQLVNEAICCPSFANNMNFASYLYKIWQLIDNKKSILDIANAIWAEEENYDKKTIYKLVIYLFILLAEDQQVQSNTAPA